MPDERTVAFEALDRKINAEYAMYRPLLIRGFAEYVYRQGHNARVTQTSTTSVNPMLVGQTWQAVGRKLYGEEFVEDFKKVVEAHRTARTP